MKAIRPMVKVQSRVAATLYALTESCPPVPVYSIITAVGPGADNWLADCGESLASQKLPPGWTLEWMLWTDDQSPSTHTTKVAKHTRQAGVDVKLGATGRHQGPAVARNLALYASTGQLGRQLDADDTLIGSEDLNHDITHMLEHPEHVFRASRTINLYEDGTRHLWGAPDRDGTPIPGTEVPNAGELPRGWIADQLLADNGVVNIHCGAVCFRTLAARACGGWLGIWPNEDTGLLLRLSETGPGWYDPDHVSHLYRFWNGASTADFYAEELDTDIRMIQSWTAVSSLIHTSRMQPSWRWQPNMAGWTPADHPA